MPNEAACVYDCHNSGTNEASGIAFKIVWKATLPVDVLTMMTSPARNTGSSEVPARMASMSKRAAVFLSPVPSKYHDVATVGYVV